MSPHCASCPLIGRFKATLAEHPNANIAGPDVGVSKRKRSDVENRENKKAKIELADDFQDRLVTLLKDETARDRSVTVPVRQRAVILSDASLAHQAVAQRAQGRRQVGRRKGRSHGESSRCTRTRRRSRSRVLSFDPLHCTSPHCSRCRCSATRHRGGPRAQRDDERFASHALEPFRSIMAAPTLRTIAGRSSTRIAARSTPTRSLHATSIRCEAEEVKPKWVSAVASRLAEPCERSTDCRSRACSIL